MPPSSGARGAIALALSFAALTCPASAGAAGLPAELPRGHVPGQVVVRFDRDAGARERAAARAAVGATIGRRLALAGGELFELRRGVTVREAVAALEARSGVRYAEPNHFASAQACPVALRSGLCVPSDPKFTQQWTMNNTGQAVNGNGGSIRDADVDAAEAWAISRGSDDVVVAVVDSGIAYDHPDLAERMWTNAGELGTDGRGADKRSNRVDDDGNGYVDDWRGWDVVGRSVLDPSDADNDPRDVSSHGTHVAGIIGAATGNGKGVAGLNWNVRLMNVRVRAERSNETSADIADAFVYAARNGARVVNVSLAERERSRYLEDTIEAHPDVLFVIAAGNNGYDVGRPGNESFPCEYPAANIVCVAATGRKDELASWSNRNPALVDLAAPGVITLSTVSAYRYVYADTFETNPFGSPARWSRGAAAGSTNWWGATTAQAFRSRTSLTNRVSNAPHQPGSVTWVQTTTPVDLTKETGCDVETLIRSAADPNSGLFVQARADRRFMAPSRTPAQDTPTPANDTVGFFAGSVAWRRVRTNISDLDGGPVYLRYGVIATTNRSVAPPQSWVDEPRIRCMSDTYSAAATTELGYMAGTSMATPHVAGTAALILSLRPQRTAAELKADLLRSVDVLPGLAGKVATGGRLNAYKALARSEVGVEGGILTVRAGEGQRNAFTIARATVGGVPAYRIRDPWAAKGISPMRGSFLDAGAGCESVSDTEVTCRAGTITGIAVDAGDLDDTVVATGVAVPAVLTGGPGKDVLTGGAAADAFSGGPGNDTINARERRADSSFDCGEETPAARDVDRVIADLADPVTANASNCESVSRA